MQLGSQPLEILFRSDRFIVIDKPSGLLTHRTELARHERDCCMTRLRNQLGSWVYPVNRLDRATSGLVLFALDAEAAESLAALFRERKVQKNYLAVVRGYAPDSG